MIFVIVFGGLSVIFLTLARLLYNWYALQLSELNQLKEQFGHDDEQMERGMDVIRARMLRADKYMDISVIGVAVSLIGTIFAVIFLVFQ